MRKPIVVNGINFKTQKDLMSFVRDILLQNDGEEITPMDDDYQFLDELMDRHPKRPETIKGDIKLFRVIRNLNNALAINIEDDEGIKDVSWNRCVTGIAKKPTDKLNNAMRTAITGQTIEFKDFRFTEGDACKCCGDVMTTRRDAHVDHKDVDFVDIKNKFLENRKDIPTEFRKTALHEPYSFKKCDKVFRDDWVLFHEQVATLQILCASCNMTKKRSGK